jgi:hypothetical protein
MMTGTLGVSIEYNMKKYATTVTNATMTAIIRNVKWPALLLLINRLAKTPPAKPPIVASV